MSRRKPNIIKFVIILLFLGIWIGAFALDTDQYKEMHVVADSASYDRTHRIITYDGKVQVDQGTSHLDGDHVLVHQLPTGDKIQQVIAYGKPAHYNTIPAPNKNRLYVEALKITYDPIKKTVLLEGHARVNQDGNIFTGPRIWYDMINGVVHSYAGPAHERTEMVIQPQQKTPPKK